MKRLTHALSFALIALSLAACSKPTSGPAPAGSAAKTAAVAAPSGSPEDNYVATAAEIACLGLSLDDAEAFAKSRAHALSAHAYTEDTWLAASKEFGAARGDAVVKAIKPDCEP